MASKVWLKPPRIRYKGLIINLGYNIGVIFYKENFEVNLIEKEVILFAYHKEFRK